MRRPFKWHDHAGASTLGPRSSTAPLSHAHTLAHQVAYDQSKTQGPPFSTPEADVRALFGSHFNIQVVESTPTTIRGEVPAKQDVYLLTRKPAQ